MNENSWCTHSINTAECFEYRGSFVVVLDASRETFVPRVRGMCRVGNLIRVPRGAVKKPLAPYFIITVSDSEPFSLPADAVREIRDEDRELICIRAKGEECVLPPFPFLEEVAFFSSKNHTEN